MGLITKQYCTTKQLDTHFVRCWTECQKIAKYSFEILGESWCIKILLWAKLASGLSHNGVNDIKSWKLILRLTLQIHTTPRLHQQPHFITLEVLQQIIVSY